MNNAEKLEEIKRLCQSIINYEADYIDDSNYETAEMILDIIEHIKMDKKITSI